MASSRVPALRASVTWAAQTKGQSFSRAVAMMASSPSFGFTDDWKRRKLLVLSTRLHISGLNIMMLNGPRTLPRPSATASKIGRCSEATCSLVVIGVTRGMGTSSFSFGARAPAFLFKGPQSATRTNEGRLTAPPPAAQYPLGERPGLRRLRRLQHAARAACPPSPRQDLHRDPRRGLANHLRRLRGADAALRESAGRRGRRRRRADLAARRQRDRGAGRVLGCP